jgi:hypothetical protein
MNKNFLKRLQKLALAKKRKEELEKRKEELKKKKEAIKKSKEDTVIREYIKSKHFLKIKINELEPIQAVNNTFKFLSKQLPELQKEFISGDKILLKRILIKKFESYSGQLDMAKDWSKSTIKNEIDDIKELKKVLNSNKKVLNKKSKEVLDKAKEEVDIIKKGTALKIKYMYIKASGEEIQIPLKDKSIMRQSKLLVMTNDPDAVKKAPIEAIKLAKQTMTQKNEPSGTKANINTDVDTGANTSSYFGATLGKRLEKFDNTNTKINFFIIIFSFALFIYIVNTIIVNYNRQ